MKQIRNRIANKKFIVGGVIVVICLSILSLTLLEDYKLSHIESLHDETYTIEYGDSFDFDIITDLYKDYDTNFEFQLVSKQEENSQDLVNLEEYEFIVSKTRMSFSVKTIDTKAPIISGDLEYEAEEGTEIEYKNLTAEDPVDGAIDIDYTGEVDFDIPDEYIVIATAIDKHGLKDTVEITITVTKKEDKVIANEVIDNTTTQSTSTTNNQSNHTEGKAQPSTQENIVEEVPAITNTGNPVADIALNSVGNNANCTQLVTGAFYFAYGIEATEFAHVFEYDWGNEYSITPSTVMKSKHLTIVGDMQVGDVLYYSDGGVGQDHVAIYVGQGMAVHGGFPGHPFGNVELASIHIGSGVSKIGRYTGH